MKIKCIDNKDCEKELALDKIYEVIDETYNDYSEKVYKIRNNSNIEKHYLVNRFQEISSNMKVKCIENKGLKDCLTIGEIYEVIDETSDGEVIKILTDSNYGMYYPKDCFIPISEYKEEEYKKNIHNPRTI